jgi:hypothetical protein
MSSIMIRVTPDDHDRWFKAHSACEEARREYGMSDGPLYRDAVDPTVTLVTLEVQELDRAMGWFADERFQRAAQAAGPATREMWIAERRG